MVHCWLQEYFATSTLRHRVLRQSVGMLQRCFWRTDKWRVHYGTSISSHGKAIGCTDDRCTHNKVTHHSCRPRRWLVR
jgi:hypothetical protein